MIGIVKRAAVMPGQQPSHRGLAGTHQSHEVKVVSLAHGAIVREGVSEEEKYGRKKTRDKPALF
jgi:hypothetical protein